MISRRCERGGKRGGAISCPPTRRIRRPIGRRPGASAGAVGAVAEVTYRGGMFFWIGLLVVAIVFIALFRWGARGIEGRAHKPGTQRLK
jgi:hypothetical protein